MSVKSAIWVQAHLRRCNAVGLAAMLIRRGAEEAGSIYVKINRLDGGVLLIGPAPGPAHDHRGERRWVKPIGDAPCVRKPTPMPICAASIRAIPISGSSKSRLQRYWSSRPHPRRVNFASSCGEIYIRYFLTITRSNSARGISTVRRSRKCSAFNTNLPIAAWQTSSRFRQGRQRAECSATVDPQGL